MKTITVAEKHFLKQITKISEMLTGGHKQVAPGFLVALVRKRLRMSQQVLAKRSKLPQSMISKIESGKVEPSLTTLKKIFDALYCDVMVVPIPRKDYDEVIQEQATRIAKKRIGYLRGTMALEKQEPKSLMIKELIKEEEKQIMNSTSVKIWEE